MQPPLRKPTGLSIAARWVVCTAASAVALTCIAQYLGYLQVGVLPAPGNAAANLGIAGGATAVGVAGGILKQVDMTKKIATVEVTQANVATRQG